MLIETLRVNEAQVVAVYGNRAGRNCLCSTYVWGCESRRMLKRQVLVAQRNAAVRLLVCFHIEIFDWHFTEVTSASQMLFSAQIWKSS